MDKFDEVNRLLLPYVSQTSKLPGEEKVIERTAKLMQLAGDPHNKLRVIHIAGTSGKTSTAYYVSALLGKVVKRVGLMVSPHVDYVSERVQVNNRQLDPKEFYLLLREYLNLIEEARVKATYFELLYGFGFYLFAQQKVDYAVVETGVGGLYDSTNIVSREDKLCVITDIGMDHMNLLGDTIEKIAAQKAGIIHPGNAVVTFKQSPEISKVIKDQARRCNSELLLIDPIPPIDLVGGGLPQFQKHNWWLAYNAYKCLAKRDGLRILNQAELRDSQKTYIPARMETIEFKGKILILDGAHNEQKLGALIDSFQAKYPGEKATLLLAFKEQKDLAIIGQIVSPVADNIILTKFKSSIELPPKPIEPAAIASFFDNAGRANVRVEPDEDKALVKALNSSTKLVVISGSFYLLSQLRAARPWLKAKV